MTHAKTDNWKLGEKGSHVQPGDLCIESSRLPVRTPEGASIQVCISHPPLTNMALSAEAWHLVNGFSQLLVSPLPLIPIAVRFPLWKRPIVLSGEQHTLLLPSNY